MSILMRGNKIGVEKVGKSSSNLNGIIMPDVADSLGIIRYVGDSVETDIVVGLKVYYGTKRQQIRMGGSDIEVMESDNVLAIVEDALNDKKNSEKQT